MVGVRTIMVGVRTIMVGVRFRVAVGVMVMQWIHT